MTGRRTVRDWLVLALAILMAAGLFASHERLDQIMRALVAPTPAQGTGLRGTGLQGVATVTDGDTLEIHGQRIRLHGIDAPESGQSCADAKGALYRCGHCAARALADRIGDGVVRCEQTDIDHRYTRVVAVCSQNGVDLNRWLVETGQALAYRRYSPDYVKAEEIAQAAQRGIWAGRFVAPWDWRKGARLEREAAPQPSPAPEGCERRAQR